MNNSCINLQSKHLFLRLMQTKPVILPPHLSRPRITCTVCPRSLCSCWQSISRTQEKFLEYECPDILFMMAIYCSVFIFYQVIISLAACRTTLDSPFSQNKTSQMLLELLPMKVHDRKCCQLILKLPHSLNLYLLPLLTELLNFPVCTFLIKILFLNSMTCSKALHHPMFHKKFNGIQSSKSH